MSPKLWGKSSHAANTDQSRDPPLTPSAALHSQTEEIRSLIMREMLKIIIEIIIMKITIMIIEMAYGNNYRNENNNMNNNGMGALIRELTEAIRSTNLETLKVIKNTVVNEAPKAGGPIMTTYSGLGIFLEKMRENL